MFELLELLTKVNAQILRAMSPLVKEYKVSVSELIILWKINKKGPCKITDFASETGLPASTLTSLFDRLETKELTTRLHDPQDRRCILIQGTENLKKLIDTIIKKADQRLTPMLDTLSPEFVDQLQQNLIILQDQLKQYAIDSK